MAVIIQVEVCEREKALLLSLLGGVQVKASDPAALEVVSCVQSLLAKLNRPAPPPEPGEG